MVLVTLPHMDAVRRVPGEGRGAICSLTGTAAFRCGILWNHASSRRFRFESHESRDHVGRGFAKLCFNLQRGLVADRQPEASSANYIRDHLVELRVLGTQAIKFRIVRPDRRFGVDPFSQRAILIGLPRRV